MPVVPHVVTVIELHRLLHRLEGGGAQRAAGHQHQPSVPTSGTPASTPSTPRITSSVAGGKSPIPRQWKCGIPSTGAFRREEERREGPVSYSTAPAHACPQGHILRAPRSNIPRAPAGATSPRTPGARPRRWAAVLQEGRLRGVQPQPVQHLMLRLRLGDECLEVKARQPPVGSRVPLQQGPHAALADHRHGQRLQLHHAAQGRVAHEEAIGLQPSPAAPAPRRPPA